MSDHAQTLLAAIIPHRRDLLIVAMQHLQPEHFRDLVLKNIFQLLEKYYDIAGDVMPAKTLSELLTKQDVDETKQVRYEQAFGEMVEMIVPDHEFRYAISALKDARSQQLTGEALVTGYEILERGVEIDGEMLKGQEAARQYGYTEFAKIDKLNFAEASPEGDIRMEQAEVLQDYADRKAGKHKTGCIMTGIPSIDRVTGGFQNGELILLCGFTGQGKSQAVTQTGWHAAVEQGKNTLIVTSETVRPHVRRRIVARHSRLPQFGLQGGLNVRDIRDGTLSLEEEEVLRAVTDDLRTNPAYGHIDVKQFPRGGTFSYFEASCRRIGEQWPIDLIIDDYLALKKPDRRRQTAREEYDDILQDAKVFATSFYSGRGVPFMSPWQMSRSAYTAALQSGGYQLASLSETSQAEKSPDHLWSLLRLPDNPNEVKVQCLKNRDGDTPEPFMVQVDYRNAYLGERGNVLSEDGMDMSSLLEMT